MLYAIAAVDQKGCLGRDNAIPWRVPADLQMFKHLTVERQLLMGRKTYQSLPRRPLSKRMTYVVTRDAERNGKMEWNKDYDGSALFTSSDPRSIAKVFSGNRDRDLIVCGGAELYHQLEDLIDGFYVTVIETVIDDGDTFLRLQSNWQVCMAQGKVPAANGVPGYQFQYWEKSK